MSQASSEKVPLMTLTMMVVGAKTVEQINDLAALM